MNIEREIKIVNTLLKISLCTFCFVLGFFGYIIYMHEHYEEKCYFGMVIEQGLKDRLKEDLPVLVRNRVIITLDHAEQKRIIACKNMHKAQNKLSKSAVDFLGN